MICLICSGLRIGVVSQDVAPPCSPLVAIVFCRVVPGSSVSSDPIGDGGAGVVGLGGLSSVKALSSPSPRDERSRFSSRRSMSFSLLVSPFCLFLRCCWLTQPNVTMLVPRVILAVGNR